MLVGFNEYVFSDENQPFTSNQWIWHTEIPAEYYLSPTELISYKTGVFFSVKGKSYLSSEGIQIINK